MGQGFHSAILAVHWAGTFHFTHHHSQFAAVTRHSQNMSTTHKVKYFSVVFLWKMRDMGFWFQLPYVTVGRSRKRENHIFWFGYDQTHQKRVLKPTVSQDRNRYLRVEKTYIIRQREESCLPALLLFWYSWIHWVKQTNNQKKLLSHNKKQFLSWQQ